MQEQEWDVLSWIYQNWTATAREILFSFYSYFAEEAGGSWKANYGVQARLHRCVEVL